MDANDEKINAVLTFANRLIEDNHYAADKIHKKAENINERWLMNLWLKYDPLVHNWSVLLKFRNYFDSF